MLIKKLTKRGGRIRDVRPPNPKPPLSFCTF